MRVVNVWSRRIGYRNALAAALTTCQTAFGVIPSPQTPPSRLTRRKMIPLSLTAAARRPRVNVDISPDFRKQLGAVLELAASQCTRRETVDLFGVSAEQVLSTGPIRAAKL